MSNTVVKVIAIIFLAMLVASALIVLGNFFASMG